jgi:hypothetical protein
MKNKVSSIKDEFLELDYIIDKYFHDSDFVLLKSIKNFNSKVYLLNVSGTNIILKFFNFGDSQSILWAYRNMENFFELTRNSTISCPKPLFIDIYQRAIGMEYIKGVTLYNLVYKCRLISDSKINDLISLSALAFSEYHKLFNIENNFNSIQMDPIIINYDRKNIDKYLQDCNLDFKTRIFHDPNLKNIIFDNDFSKCHLIDFPYKCYLFSPHYDIAYFGTALEILLLAPQFCNSRMKKTVFQNFIDIYFDNLGISPNKNDLTVLKYFRFQKLTNLAFYYKSKKLDIFALILSYLLQRAIK